MATVSSLVFFFELDGVDVFHGVLDAFVAEHFLYEEYVAVSDLGERGAAPVSAGFAADRQQHRVLEFCGCLCKD